MRTATLILIFCSLLTTSLLSGCDQQKENQKVPEVATEKSQQQDNSLDQGSPSPPTPPLVENFDGQPKLSLFPRVGDYQPDREDERFPFWKTFIDHFSKTSGLLKNPETKNFAWSFRGIKSIDSVAYFTPLAVEPNTEYRVSYRVKTELPEGAKTGVGITEYKEFLWIGEQYTEKTSDEFILGSRMAIELAGSIDWEKHEFVWITSPEAKMIHLIFYREGAHSRKPVLIDDIEVTKTER
jgi:hypothetical protein